MTTTRRKFLLGTLGVAAASRIDGLAFGSPAESIGAGYGSGHFGRWIEDEYGLPAYLYTMDQTTDRRAVTLVQPGVLGGTEHVHQVGNDRIIALASNYGHVRVRQDEGSPKFLNDVDPEMGQYGGGLGYLTDGQETLSTYYDGAQHDFRRVFGIGYFRKKVSGKKCTVDQVIAAPFGDDPVLVSQVTITNTSESRADVRWVEYWGCEPYQFSFRSAIDAMSGKGTATQWRRELGRRFGHSVAAIDQKKGLVEEKRFLGRSAEEEAAWKRGTAGLRANSYGFYTAVEEPRQGTDFESLDLPRTFLVSLDGAADGLSCDGAAFFGKGGPANPSGLAERLNGKLDECGSGAALLLERTVRIEPKESRTLSFLYGYVPEGFSLEALISKYEQSKGSALETTALEWKRHGMRFEVPSEPWVKRESTWNHYYLRSSLTYDDFFGEHILNQNGYYQYVMGFQGAPRDPLQHSMPFLFSDPEIVRSVLRYTLKEVRADGSLPYGIVGHGVVAPMLSDRASDLPLWLMWAVSEYVLATRDVDFLKERIPARLSPEAGQTEDVRELLHRCFRHQVDQVGLGRHGVMRMLVDDWNDGLIYTWASNDMKECIEQGESVLNSAMAAWVFGQYGRMLAYAGGSEDFVKESLANAERHREATRAQWNGKWFRRVWLGEKLGWLGESTLWIEPQPWAMLAGATTDQQNRELVRTIDGLLRRGPLGTAQMSEGPDMQRPGGADHGSLELGAIWPSLNQTLVWALAGVDPAMAWDEWKRNTLARHAESYPDLWYGIWSGNDSYNSWLSRHPGGAADEPYFRGTDFPVLNLHSHACSLYSASKLVGIEFTQSGLSLRLTLPLEAYRLDSPLVGVVKERGRYEGWYAPHRAGTWTVEIIVPRNTDVKWAQVNGKRLPIRKEANGAIRIRGEGGPEKPFRWALN
jgi:hypothetical protein